MLALESIGCLVKCLRKLGCCSVPPHSGTAYIGPLTYCGGRSSLPCRSSWQTQAQVMLRAQSMHAMPEDSYGGIAGARRHA